MKSENTNKLQSNVLRNERKVQPAKQTSTIRENIEVNIHNSRKVSPI